MSHAGAGAGAGAAFQESASVSAYFALLAPWETYLRKVGRQDTSVADRHGAGSSWWKPGAANGAICQSRLLLLRAIPQLAPRLPGTTPSLCHLKAGERHGDRINSSRPATSANRVIHAMLRPTRKLELKKKKNSDVARTQGEF